MKKLLLIIFILYFLNACSKYDIPECDFNDPTQDLIWLKNIIAERIAQSADQMRYCYITQATLERKTVFILRDCNPFIDKVTFVTNCEGEFIKNTDGENIGADKDHLKDERIIWRPIDFGCDINGNTIN